jgi:hypothetical protein
MVGGYPSEKGDILAPGKGVVLMMTYTEFFEFCLVAIGIIDIALRFGNKKK